MSSSTSQLARFRAKDWLDWIFEIGIVLKGIDGLLEVVGGVLLLVLTPAEISGLVHALTQHELSQDPRDLIASLLLHAADGLTMPGLLFGAGYLLVHGIVKIVLVLALLRNRFWAYPWTIGVLLIFIGYQVYRIVLTPTLGLIALTGFDIVVVALTWREYKRQRVDRVSAAARAEVAVRPHHVTSTIGGPICLASITRTWPRPARFSTDIQWQRSRSRRPKES